MRIAITGATGFVGSSLLGVLQSAGHDVVTLTRRARDRTDAETGPAPTAAWDPATGEVDAKALGPIDAIVHLAGENVAGGRWTRRRKTAIADSRGPTTLRLFRFLASLPNPPQIVVSASATGIYGDRGDELLDESSVPGRGFLAEVAQAWEAGTAPLANAGSRVVLLRIGMVLDPTGGALQKMLLPFRMGIGGRLGHGRQWTSWITRHDLVRAIVHALQTDSLSGPTLATTPNPVTNAEFTRTLGKVLRRPTVLPAPRFALRLALGEMAEALLLASQRANPRALAASGFTFEQPTLEAALRELFEA